jgi:hypothetical protein
METQAHDQQPNKLTGSGELKTYQYKRARKNGAPFSLVSWLTTLRSGGVHSEYRFSARYKGVSFSCTNADKAKCCRFKMIEYSNPEYWDTDPVCATEIKEDDRLIQALRLADVTLKQFDWWLNHAQPGDLIYGPNAVKYDLAGTALSYISHLDIYPSHPLKKRCCEAVANIIIASDPWLCQLIDPEKISPDDLQTAIRQYFK